MRVNALRDRTTSPGVNKSVAGILELWVEKAVTDSANPGLNLVFSLALLPRRLPPMQLTRHHGPRFQASGAPLLSTQGTLQKRGQARM